MALKFSRLLTNCVTNIRIVPQRGIKKHVSTTLIELKKRQAEYLENLTEEEYNELHRRSNFSEWNYGCEIYAFGKRLHEEIPPELLVQAFTHRSYIVQNELKLKELGVEPSSNDLSKDNNELAEEGEKIIRDYSGRYVSYFYPRFPLEGIESITDYLSSEEVLAHVSKNLGTTFLILSADYPVQPETYSKTLKAIVGAVKECQGVQRSQLFVRDFIVTELAGKDVNDFLKINNYFEVLSEILKKDGKDSPEPRILCQDGMKTILANYHIGIYSNKKLIGHCSGENIETGVEMAALDALKRLFLTTDSCTPISYDVKDVPERITNLRLNEWCSKKFEKSKPALK